MTVNHFAYPTPCEYVTSPNGPIHIAAQDAMARQDARTLCGRPITGEWAIGDETVSGIAAHCGNCRRIIKTRTSH